MQIYSFYGAFSMIFGEMAGKYFPDAKTLLIAAAVGALVVWLPLFILMAIGLYKMAKGQNLRIKWMAFFPFINTFYAG